MFQFNDVQDFFHFSEKNNLKLICNRDFILVEGKLHFFNAACPWPKFEQGIKNLRCQGGIFLNELDNTISKL